MSIGRGKKIEKFIDRPRIKKKKSKFVDRLTKKRSKKIAEKICEIFQLGHEKTVIFFNLSQDEPTPPR